MFGAVISQGDLSLITGIVRFILRLKIDPLFVLARSMHTRYDTKSASDNLKRPLLILLWSVLTVYFTIYLLFIFNRLVKAYDESDSEHTINK